MSMRILLGEHNQSVQLLAIHSSASCDLFLLLLIKYRNFENWRGETCTYMFDHVFRMGCAMNKNSSVLLVIVQSISDFCENKESENDEWKYFGKRGV